MTQQPDGGIKCGSCGAAFDYARVYGRFAGSADYSTYFDFHCECGAEIEVQVESIPEFSVVRTRAAAKESTP